MIFKKSHKQCRFADFMAFKDLHMFDPVLKSLVNFFHPCLMSNVALSMRLFSLGPGWHWRKMLKSNSFYWCHDFDCHWRIFDILIVMTSWAIVTSKIIVLLETFTLLSLEIWSDSKQLLDDFGNSLSCVLVSSVLAELCTL